MSDDLYWRRVEIIKSDLEAEYLGLPRHPYDVWLRLCLLDGDGWKGWPTFTPFRSVAWVKRAWWWAIGRNWAWLDEWWRQRRDDELGEW